MHFAANMRLIESVRQNNTIVARRFDGMGFEGNAGSSRCIGDLA